ncbi:hypothetical protein Esti_000274 [Eimeria stiedai]
MSLTDDEFSDGSVWDEGSGCSGSSTSSSGSPAATGAAAGAPAAGAAAGPSPYERAQGLRGPHGAAAGDQHQRRCLQQRAVHVDQQQQQQQQGRRQQQGQQLQEQQQQQEQRDPSSIASSFVAPIFRGLSSTGGASSSSNSSLPRRSNAAESFFSSLGGGGVGESSEGSAASRARASCGAQGPPPAEPQPLQHSSSNSSSYSGNSIRSSSRGHSASDHEEPPLSVNPFRSSSSSSVVPALTPFEAAHTSGSNGSSSSRRNSSSSSSGLWTQPETCGCEPPGPRAAHSCDAVGSRLFFFGGWNGSSPMNDLYVLECEVDCTTAPPAAAAAALGGAAAAGGARKLRWHFVPRNNQTPPARNNHTSAVSGSEVYIHGGHDGSQWLGDLHILDAAAVLNSSFQEARWRRPQVSGQAPSARACHTFSRVREKLFLFGGYDGHRCFNDIEVLDLETLVWMQPMVSGEKPLPRNAHSMTVVDHRLFLFGGHSGTKHLTDLHIFDTTTLTWIRPQLRGSPPPGVRGHSATLVGSRIFLFGGFDGRKRTNDVSVFCVRTLSWRQLRDNEALRREAPAGRQRHSAALVGNRQILFFGGFDGSRWLDDLHAVDTTKLDEAAISKVAVKQLLSSLRQLLEGGEFSDVTLVVGGRRIPAHRNILSASCPFFRQMFLGQMKESAAQEVEIHGWSYEAYMAMLGFIYTGTLTEAQPAVLSEVLGLADHYTLTTLKRYCEHLLCGCLDLSSVCSLLRCAESYQAQQLKERCVAFLFRHADLLCNTPQFDELQAMPSLLMEIAKLSLASNRQGFSSTPMRMPSAAAAPPAAAAAAPAAAKAAPPAAPQSGRR